MTHSQPVADAAVMRVSSRENERALLFVGSGGSILGSPGPVFSFSTLPFLHKTKAGQMCTAKLKGRQNSCVGFSASAGVALA